MSRTRIINIPHTKEMGWALQKSGSRHYIPTKKSFWNRLQFIVEARGGKLERTTTGFEVLDIILTDADREIINKEMKDAGIRTEIPAEITIGKSGREEPNLEEDTDLV